MNAVGPLPKEALNEALGKIIIWSLSSVSKRRVSKKASSEDLLEVSDW